MRLSKTASDVLSADAAIPTKLMAARGLLPLPPAESLIVLYRLTHEDDEAVRDSAVQALEGFPRSLVAAASEHLDEPEVISYLVQRFRGDATVVERLVARPQVPDDALCFLAEFSEDPIVLRLIAERRDRIQTAPRIFHCMKRNPMVPRSLLLQIAAEVPGLAESPDGESAEGQPFGPSREEKEFAACLVSPASMDEEFSTIRVALRRLDTAAKKALAHVCNAPTRYQLIQDGDQRVGLAVLEHPHITLEEVIRFSGLRNLSQEIVRRIGTDPAWSREPRVRNMLVKNPVTPNFLILRFVEGVNSLSELTRLATSRDVSTAVNRAARVMLERRQFRQGTGVPTAAAKRRRAS